MMNKVVLSAALVLGALALPVAPASAQNFDQVQIRATEITPTIYMLEGAGGNIGVSIGPDGTLIVDDQYAPLTDRIVAAIAEITDEPVTYVVNTHWHYDHSGGNENFGGLGALIVSHENSRTRMLSEQYVEVGDVTQAPYVPAGVPKITFDESMRFHYNGQTTDLFHIGNAHTDGDAAVYFREANVLHTGDVFVRYGLPFIDSANGGSIDGMIRFVDAMIQRIGDDTVVIPGHGALATRQDMIDYRDMLQTIRDRIREGIAAGRSLEQITESNPAEGFGPGNPEDFVRRAYNGMSR